MIFMLNKLIKIGSYLFVIPLEYSIQDKGNILEDRLMIIVTGLSLNPFQYSFTKGCDRKPSYKYYLYALFKNRFCGHIFVI